MSRVWRTQLANLCLQRGFTSLNTTKWVTSLSNVDSSEDSLAAKRKRLKHALAEDVSAAEYGLNAGNHLSPELRSTFKKNSLQNNQSARLQDRLDSWESIMKGSDNPHLDRGFVFGEDKMATANQMHNVPSFSSLDAFFTTQNHSRSPPEADLDPFDIDAQSDMGVKGGVLCEEVGSQESTSKQSIDRVIDSVVKEALFLKGEEQGIFLQKVSNYISTSDFNFQHCDLWVPTALTDLSYEDDQIRLTNAGNITVKSSKVPSHIIERFSEFGVYSKTFSFAPGSGLPGRVFASGQPSWMNNVHEAKAEEFGRVAGAKIYGVSTAVGLPVLSSKGTIVVILYSTEDLPRDINVENQCMNFFCQLNPTPKWRLCIDVADDETEGFNATQTPVHPCVVPSSPISDVSGQTLNYDLSFFDWKNESVNGQNQHSLHSSHKSPALESHSRVVSDPTFEFDPSLDPSSCDNFEFV